MKYTRADIVIGTVIKISSQFTITGIKNDQVFFDKEKNGWDIDTVVEKVNKEDWKVISIPQNIYNYEIY